VKLFQTLELYKKPGKDSSHGSEPQKLQLSAGQFALLQKVLVRFMKG